jgi:F0F1-type ATP synthase assembly protein I
MRQQITAFGAVSVAALLATSAFAFPLALGTRFFLLVAAGLCSTTGFVLYFPTWLDKATLPLPAQRLVDRVMVEVEDDIEAARQCRITTTHGMALATLVLSIVFVALVLAYAKLDATWGGIPVLIPTAIAIFFAIFVMTQSRWYRRRSFRTPAGTFLVPLAGIVVATSLGIYMTEPLEAGGSSAYQRATASGGPAAAYDYSATRAYWIYLDWFTPGSTEAGIPNIDIGSCDGDECLVLLLIIALVVVTVSLVVGSILIPHFWVLAGFTLLTIMGMIALRELRVRPVPGARPG